ncbi:MULTISPECIES: thymidylate synthase [unclassified Paenarthrobacter]|uniref:thymidylate synthase n=1 Tax=unclassified Paenarthrobacter TaxID=2634190 RepID=UPI003CF4019D
MTQYRNLSSALQGALTEIETTGSEVLARGQNQREIIGYRTTMTSPQERVVVLPGRKNNIFAQIAETLWVLAGRDDMDFLSRYLPRAVDFSDNGTTWRAAYGPRLRKWNGQVDQLAGVLQRFHEDINTKRAVASIYDPASDFVDSKDVPCNNWLNFIQRDGRLHLNVSVRANDAIWGFSGINVFEWSVTLELIAASLGLAVGELNWFVGSMHVYERHYSVARRITSNAPVESPYHYGVRSLPILSTLDAFDHGIVGLLEVESQFRRGNYSATVDLSDPFLDGCEQMLRIHNMHLNGVSQAQIVDVIGRLPASDFRIGAIEFFARKWDLAAFRELSLTPSERAFLSYHANLVVAENLLHEVSV